MDIAKIQETQQAAKRRLAEVEAGLARASKAVTQLSEERLVLIGRIDAFEFALVPEKPADEPAKEEVKTDA